jgi:hypothetical protein
VPAQLIGRGALFMNHEVSARRPDYRTCLIAHLFWKMSDNSRYEAAHAGRA